MARARFLRKDRRVLLVSCAVFAFVPKNCGGACRIFGRFFIFVGWPCFWQAF